MSLPWPDVAYLERHVERHRLPSRSATLHEAVQALRERELENQYAEAYEESEISSEAVIWESVTADGIEPGMRRGAVWTVESDPARRSDAATSPRCVVVSRDASNRAVERWSITPRPKQNRSGPSTTRGSSRTSAPYAPSTWPQSMTYSSSTSDSTTDRVP